MSGVDLSFSQVIRSPSTLLLPENEESRRVRPSFQYLPFSKSLVFLSSPQLVTFINVEPNLVVRHSKKITFCGESNPEIFSLHEEKSVLALGIPYVYHDYENTTPAHVQLVKISPNPFESQTIEYQSEFFINPHLLNCSVTKMKHFPDGSKFIVSYSHPRNGSWCKIYTLPQSWEDVDSNSEESTAGPWCVPVGSRILQSEEINVFEQGFPLPEPKAERLNDPDLTDEEYFDIYNERYYSSYLDGGFLCLAISPDTTRLLAGTNDAEIYVLDSTTLKVLHCKRKYGYCKCVTGCDYNPLFGHDEFAVCNEVGVFDIWNINTLDDGSEELNKVHHLKFSPGICNCVYSPDGKLIALTSGADCKTYVISSSSANVMYILTCDGVNDVDEHETLFFGKSLFFGHSCQLATVYQNPLICFWQLPVVYNLKTLCLIFLRASVKYNDIEKLCIPSSLKTLVKYLYV